MTCPLCRLAKGLDRSTRLYYEDPVCIIVDCRTCGPDHPMLVFKAHREWTPKEVQHCLDAVDRVFGQNVEIRWGRRQIKDHPHIHIEVKK